MTTIDQQNAGDDAPLPQEMTENLLRIEQLSQRLIAAFAKRPVTDPALEGPGPDLMAKVGAAYMQEMIANPAKVMELQVGYWAKMLEQYSALQQATIAEFSANEETDAGQQWSPANWGDNPFFSYVRQQFETNAETLRQAARDLDGIEGIDRQRLTYFTDQIINLFAPENFLGTNPEALTKALETEGASLVEGLENLVRDVEANNGELLVTLADKDAFQVGENIASSKGAVVFRNRMLELIQFSPSTDTVYKTPVLIFPPWINRYYILDLKPKNSLIQWLTDQGHTVFVVSWVNPDESFADVGLDTYVEEGYLEAIRATKAVTGEDQINVVGYCVAGTVLSLTLGLLAHRGDTSVKSATFFTTMTDFSDQGEFGVFLQDDFVDGIERQIARDGVLRSYFMSRTFSFLRSNDLIYKPAIKSYMMGEAPPAFDLLYWNGDSTNLPGRMTVEYLRGLCQRNELAEGGFEICGDRVELSDITLPTFFVTCETDHIAAWKACYKGYRQFGGKSKTFVLSQSGHIAGIVNPPSKGKYGHYMNGGPKGEPEAWQAKATFHDGSWWPTWHEWLSKGEKAEMPARTPGSNEFPALTAAPGTYVHGLGSTVSDK